MKHLNHNDGTSGDYILPKTCPIVYTKLNVQKMVFFERTKHLISMIQETFGSY